MPTVSPLMIASDQERVVLKVHGFSLIKSLTALNVPCITADNLPVDYVWIIDGRSYMGDNKKVPDLIGSSESGHLHKQVTSMESAVDRFILLEGEWTWDNGYNVGNADHSWSWEAFDSLLESLQEEGIKIVHSFSATRTPYRLKALYNRSQKENRGSWHEPVKSRPSNDPKNDIWFYDARYRNQIGALITLFDDCGVPTADKMRGQYSFMDLLGITEEGLQRAKDIWTTIPRVGKKKIEMWEEAIRG